MDSVDGVRPGQRVVAGTATATMVIPFKLFMCFDSERTGEVDTQPRDLREWTWGAGQRGPILLVNNDDDDGDGRPDFLSAVACPVGTVGPRRRGDDELAPLTIRRQGAVADASRWQAELRVDDPESIHVIDASGCVILGGEAGSSYRFTDLSFETLEWGMEATRYPSKTFNGLIELTLNLQGPNGAYQREDKAVVRVAPWIVPHHLCPTEEVYVVRGEGTDPYNSALASQLPSEVRLIEGSVSDWGSVFIQDAFELGVSTLPPAKHLPVALRTPVPADIRVYGEYAEQLLRGPDVGTTGGSVDRPSNQDLLGNLECSPPVTVNGVDYPLGRIVYGTGPFRPNWADFVEAQAVQAPFSIDVGFLSVGHVDELITFCPAPGSRLGFKVLLADTGTAHRLLEGAQRAGHGGARGPRQIDRRLSERVDGLLADTWLWDYNRNCQETLDSVETTLVRELGLSPGDIVHLPVLFEESAWSPAAVTLFPDVVNMLVVTRSGGAARLFVPDPFGPQVGGADVFRADVDAKLTALGCDVRFVDTLAYHLNEGNAHCGSNSKRTAPQERWWELTHGD